MNYKKLSITIMATALIVPTLVFAQNNDNQKRLLPPSLNGDRIKMELIKASGTKQFPTFASGTRQFPVFASGTKIMPIFATGSKPWIINASGTKQFFKSNTEALLCAELAMEKREDAIITAWTAHGIAINKALTTRKSELSDAWAKTTPKERNEARNTAWNNYGKSVKAATETLKNARKSAHTTFGNDTRACGTEVPNEDKRADLI